MGGGEKEEKESTTLMPPGEDDISEPPDYPQDGIFKRPSWSDSDGDRLEAWARCDPIEAIPTIHYDCRKVPTIENGMIQHVGC